MPHPVRCAITVSSAHKVTRGSVMAVRCAARTCPRVHGWVAQSGPQVRLRRVMTGSGDAGRAPGVASRLVPSGIWASSG